MNYTMTTGRIRRMPNAYGLYGGFDPKICRESLEDGLTANDWRYVKKYLAGNNPFLLKCVTRIKELSVD